MEAALLKHFKLDEWGHISRSTYLRLDNELKDSRVGTGQHKEMDKDEAFQLFRHMTQLILREHVGLVNKFHRQPQLAKQGDTHPEEQA